MGKNAKDRHDTFDILSPEFTERLVKACQQVVESPPKSKDELHQVANLLSLEASLVYSFLSVVDALEEV